jgi:hypothetical protein
VRVQHRAAREGVFLLRQQRFEIGAALCLAIAELARFRVWEGSGQAAPADIARQQRLFLWRGYAAGESVSALARMYAVSRANILGVVKPA